MATVITTGVTATEVSSTTTAAISTAVIPDRVPVVRIVIGPWIVNRLGVFTIPEPTPDPMRWVSTNWLSILNRLAVLNRLGVLTRLRVLNRLAVLIRLRIGAQGRERGDEKSNYC